MSLNQQLSDFMQEALRTRPADVMQVIQEAQQRLELQNLEANAKRPGESVSNFTLPNANGELVSLEELLAQGKIVLSFYRGVWCPFCNLELKALQDRLPDIEALGAKIVAISMQLPDQSMSTAEKNGLSFEVLSDVDGQVAHELGLVFQLDPELAPVYDKLGLDLSEFHGNDKYELPIPATYIIAQDRSITHVFADSNYAQRPEPEDIIAALKS